MKKRIDIIDALRGFAVTLMVLHHFLYDLVTFLGAPEKLFTNPIFDFLQFIFAGLFILLSGISSKFSHSNIKRGIKVLIVAIVISLVTHFMNMPIKFGILHLLGFSMVFYGLTGKFWNKIPKLLMPIICIALFILSYFATQPIVDVDYLWIFGWKNHGFLSYDYYPVFPWLFLFLLGTWVGGYIIDNRFPQWFYDKKIRFFPAIGKKALIIYILHQPVLYGFTLALKYLISLFSN